MITVIQIRETLPITLTQAFIFIRDTLGLPTYNDWAFPYQSEISASFREKLNHWNS